MVSIKTTIRTYCWGQGFGQGFHIENPCIPCLRSGHPKLSPGLLKRPGFAVARKPCTPRAAVSSEGSGLSWIPGTWYHLCSQLIIGLGHVLILKHTLMLAIWTKRESPKSQKRSPTTSYTHVAANLTFSRKVCRSSWFQDSNFSWGSESEAVASPRGLSTIVGWVSGSYGIHVKESKVLCWIHFVFCFRWPLLKIWHYLGIAASLHHHGWW